jgi:hypothetical protein
MRGPFIPQAKVVLALAVAMAVGSAGCSDDPAKPIAQASPYKALTVRDNLLGNLEFAYNQSNYEEYAKLFDDSGAFQFFFSPADVSQGKVRQAQWDLAAELAATGAMFDRNPPSGPTADDLDLDLQYVEADSAWEGYTPSTHPSETWYRKEVSYVVRIRIGPTTYTQNKVAYAVFTVRRVNVSGQDIWQIVTWQDDVGLPSPPILAMSAASEEDATWGGIKDLFATVP